MATYKGIKGFKVQSLASDPTAEDTVGKVWYNTTSNVLKYSAEGAGAWASGNTVNTARSLAAGMGIQTAAVWAGGTAPNNYQSETYDGTSWTEGNDLTKGRRLYTGSAGTATAGLAMGGYTTPVNNEAIVETYDGTCWSEVADLNTGRYGGGCGVQTAALDVAGQNGATLVDIVEEYNGTCWTEIADVNTASREMPATGTTTAAMKFGGKTPAATAVAEQFDGTSWTEVGDLNTARWGFGGAGTSTLALAFAGTAGPVSLALTEKYDGTSWTEVGDLGTARNNLGAAGTQSSAIGMGGQLVPGTLQNATEEWTDPVYSAKTVTTS